MANKQFKTAPRRLPTKAAMSRHYCIIYKPTGQVCEVENGICYDVHRSIEEAQASIDILLTINPRLVDDYGIAPLPRHLKVPVRSPYESKSFCRTLRVLRRGVPLHTHGRTFPAHAATFRLETTGTKYRGIVSVEGYGLIELWEHTNLDVVRRIACGYYPSLCRAFGPARLYAGV